MLALWRKDKIILVKTIIYQGFPQALQNLMEEGRGGLKSIHGEKHGGD